MKTDPPPYPGQSPPPPPLPCLCRVQYVLQTMPRTSLHCFWNRSTFFFFSCNSCNSVLRITLMQGSSPDTAWDSLRILSGLHGESITCVTGWLTRFPVSAPAEYVTLLCPVLSDCCAAIIRTRSKMTLPYWSYLGTFLVLRSHSQSAQSAHSLSLCGITNH